MYLTSLLLAVVPLPRPPPPSLLLAASRPRAAASRPHTVRCSGQSSSA
jgi:hypothetical protein